MNTPDTLQKPKVIIACSLLLLIYCFASCGPRMLDRKEIMDQYGPEVINYLYETAYHYDTAFHFDGKENKRKNTYRWDGDILVSLHGRLLQGDSILVADVLKEINSLDIPITLKLIADPNQSNMKIYFGSYEAVKDSINLPDDFLFFGTVQLYNDEFKIKSGLIGIVNHNIIKDNCDMELRTKLRKTVILEEVAQSLGVLGDSYTYYDSRFFEGAKETFHLSDLDKKIIQLLYDKRVFKNSIISRKEFEERFSEVLYDRISAEKFRGLADEYGLGRLALDSLGDMVFRPDTKDTLVKFPRTAFLKLSGDSVESDAEFCRALVRQLNTISPYFQLELVESNTVWNRYPSITVHYENKEEFKNMIYTQARATESPLMYTYHIAGDVWIKFQDTEKKIIPQKNEMMARALFKLLGLYVQEELLTNNSLDSLEISEKYRNYFRFLYDPRFPSGISKEEFEELVKEIN